MGSWFRVVRTVVGHGSMVPAVSGIRKTIFGGACPGFSGATRRILNIFCCY